MNQTVRLTSPTGSDVDLLEPAMAFGILGPLEVRGGDAGEVALGGVRQRAVVAVLLLNANEVVSIDRLVDELWGERAPSTGAKTVQVFVSRLRQALGPERDRLVTRAPGYCLRVGRGELDSERCEALYVRGRGCLAARDPESAVVALRQAELLWRGAPLAEFTYEPFAQAAVARLAELRLSCREERIEAELELGRHEQVVPALEAVVREQRLRERPLGQLMLALYRSGRQADALAVFQDARRLFVEELGVEPGSALRELQEKILRQDPSLAFGSPRTRSPAEGTSTAAPSDRSVPAPAGQPDPGPAIFPLPAVSPRATEGAFVGREGCLAQLRSRWEQSRCGETTLVVLVGEAGAGKTRLATRFSEAVQLEGAAVLYGRSDVEALHPYQPFVEALNHLIRHAGADFVDEMHRELEFFRGLLPKLGSLAATAPTHADPEIVRYQIFEAAVALLAQASRRWPLLLVLDDLHWADKPSLLLLRHILRHAGDAQLLIVVTSRHVEVGGDHPLVEFLSDVRRDRHYDRLLLDGLDEDAIRALVTDRLGAEVAPGFVRRLHEQTEGNAFFVEETVRALAESNLCCDEPITEEALETLGVPDGVAEVIARRVRLLCPLARNLLRAASVVGNEFRLGIVEQLVDAPPDAVAAALEEGMAIGLVVELPTRIDTFSFSHSLVRNALYEQLSAMRRGRLHRRVAEALERLMETEDVNPAELGHHFGLARHLVGNGPARRYEIAAGHRAAESFAYEEAAEHFRRALALFDDGDEAARCEVLLALGRVEWHAGDDQARHTFRIAAESAQGRRDPNQLARAALGLGERYFEVTQVSSSYCELLEQAAATLGPEDSALRALVLSRLAVTLGFPNENERGRRLGADAVAMVRRLSDEGALFAVLLARHVALLDARHTEERLALGEELVSLRGAHRELVAERHYWRLYDLLSVGALDAARHEQVELEQLAEELGQPLFLSIAMGSRGLWAELAGDIEKAERCAEESFGYARQAHSYDAVSAWASQVFALRRRQGRLLEIAPAVERLACSGGGELGWLAALGVLRAETGDIDAARRIYESELRTEPARLPRGMFWLTRVALLSELCNKLDDVARAHALYTAMAPFVEHNVVVASYSVWGPVEGYLALLAETMGDETLAARHAGSARARAEAMNAPLLARDIDQRHADRLVAAA